MSQTVALDPAQFSQLMELGWSLTRAGYAVAFGMLVLGLVIYVTGRSL